MSKSHPQPRVIWLSALAGLGTEEPCLSRLPACPESKELRTPIEGLRNSLRRQSLTQLRLRLRTIGAMQRLPLPHHASFIWSTRVTFVGDASPQPTLIRGGLPFAEHLRTLPGPLVAD